MSSWSTGMYILDINGAVNSWLTKIKAIRDGELALSYYYNKEYG